MKFGKLSCPMIMTKNIVYRASRRGFILLLLDQVLSVKQQNNKITDQPPAQN